MRSRPSAPHRACAAAQPTQNQYSPQHAQACTCCSASNTASFFNQQAHALAAPTPARSFLVGTCGIQCVQRATASRGRIHVPAQETDIVRRHKNARVAKGCAVRVNGAEKGLPPSGLEQRAAARSGRCVTGVTHKQPLALHASGAAVALAVQPEVAAERHLVAGVLQMGRRQQNGARA